MDLKGRDFLKLLDFTGEELAELIDLSARFKQMKNSGIAHRYCEGKNIALIFEKTSTKDALQLRSGRQGPRHGYDLSRPLRFADRP